MNFSEPNEARSLFFALRDHREQAKNLLKKFLDFMNEDDFVEQSQIDELVECLNKIIQTQNEFFNIDRLKEVAEQKSNQQIGVEIAKWEDELGKANLQNILLRLKNLTCISENEEEKKFSEPLRKQVESFWNRRAKIPLSKWLKEGQKFERLVKVVENPLNGSFDDFSQITKDFGDRVAFVFMRGLIKIPDTVEEIPDEIEEEPEQTIENSDIDTEEIMKKFSETLSKVMGDADLKQFSLDESKLVVEKKEHKKDFSVTKLRKRLTEVSISGNMVTKKLLEDLCLRNVTSVELFMERHKANAANAEGQKRRLISVQKILETLFNYGYISLCTWDQKVSFYYVDNSERAFLAKVHGNLDLPKSELSNGDDDSKNSEEDEIENYDAICNFRRYLMILSLWQTADPTIAEFVKVSADVHGDWAIAEYQQASKHCVAYFFNIIFIREDYTLGMFKFLSELRNDLYRANKGNVVGIYLVTDKSFDDAKNWLDLFSNLLNVIYPEKNGDQIKISLFCFDDELHGKIVDSAGKSSNTWKIDQKNVKEEVASEVDENSEDDQEEELDDEPDLDNESDLDEEEELLDYDDDLILQLAANALKNTHRAQAMIALSLLSKDLKANLGFNFGDDFSKVNFDEQMISMLNESFKRYLPDSADDAENALQVAFANFPQIKPSTKTENFDEVDLNSFEVKSSIRKAVDMLDQLQFVKMDPVKGAEIDTVRKNFIKALIQAAKDRFNESTPSIFDHKRFYDECLLGGQYLELSSKGIPLIFDNKSVAARLDRHLQSLEEFETVKLGAQESYRIALKNYDFGILKLLASRFSDELSDELKDFDRISDSISKRISILFDMDRTRFLGQIEMAYDHGIIEDIEQKTACRSFVTKSYGHFYKTQNEGIFRDLFRKRAVNILRKLNEIISHDPEAGRIQLFDVDKFVQNKTLEHFLHEYGNLYRTCTQDDSRAVDVKTAFAKLDKIESLVYDDVTDRALPLIERRDLAREYKLEAKYKNILLVDQVAALYLSQFTGKDFESKLIQTLLPFSNYVPKNIEGIEDFLNLGFVTEPKLVDALHVRANGLKQILSVCYRKIVESIPDCYRAEVYKKNDSPPYKIDRSSMQVIMADGKFNDAVDDAYRKLLKENDVELAMKAICLLRYRRNLNEQTDEFAIRSDNFSAAYESIASIIDDFSLSRRRLTEQLKTLTTLGILAVNEDKEYFFTQKKFWGLAGTQSDIENSLYQEAVEVTGNG